MSYHSALGKNPPTVSPMAKFEQDNCIALQHDFAQGLPEEMNDCDLIYFEPPWRDGYEAFVKRAKIENAKPYNQILVEIKNMIEQESRPIIIVTGAHALKILPTPDEDRPILLQGGKARAYMYHYTLDHEANTTLDLLTQLADKFERVADPFCGYGNTARAFLSKGKTFVMSDFNAECIGMIYQNFDFWKQNAHS